MAINSFLCADVPLRNTHSLTRRLGQMVKGQKPQSVKTYFS